MANTGLIDLLPLTYWHEYLDLVLLYKIINNYTYIDESSVPKIAKSLKSGSTRSETNENLIKFVIPFAKTVTFQTSYFIRACKTWRHWKIETLECKHSNPD